MHAKRYDEATKEYEALIKKFDPVHTDEGIRRTVRQTKLALSNIAVVQHDYPNAEEWLEQVLDEHPGDTGAYNDLGYLWADQGKHLGRSLRMVQKALDAEPKNAAYLDSVGWALYRLGRYEEAMVHLKKAVEIEEKPDSVILDHLGDAYLKAGQKAKAVETWQRALKGFDKKYDAEKIKTTQEKINKHKQ